MTSASPNLDRVTRMFALFVAVGYLGYLLLLLPPIGDTASRMAAWWTPTMVILVFGSGLSLGVASRLTGMRATRLAGSAAGAAFALAVVTWPGAWDGTVSTGTDGVWLAAFPGLAALAVVVAWPAWVAFSYMVVAVVSVQWINYAARGLDDSSVLIPEILFGVMFCSIFLGGAAMAIRTGRLLDETTDETHAVAAAAAAREARSVERERFDALTHDSVMATLLTAARGGAQARDVPALATATLAELDDIQAGTEADRPFTPESAVVHLRAAAAAVDTGAAFTVRAEPGEGDPIPAEVVRAIGAAVAEALRNCLRHADAVHRGVSGELGPDRIRIDVHDDGIGFEPATVSSHRLGIAISIRGRMARVDGGSVEIDSAPGGGTTVRLGWDRL